MTTHNNQGVPLVAIVVPVYNADQTIANCLKSLSKLKYLDYKVILVNDCSTDNSLNIMSAYSETKKHFHLLRNVENYGPAYTRNRGIKFALENFNPEYIYFTDSDCVLPQSWIQDLLFEFKEGTAVVGGSLEPASLNNIYERFEQKRRDNLYGNEKKFVNELPTCNLAITTETIKEVGLFNETFLYPSGEDFELCNRITATGKKILFCPEIKVKHFHQNDLKSVWRRGYIHGHEEMKTKSYPLAKGKILLYYLRPSIVPFRGFLRQSPAFTFVNFFFEMGKSFGKLKGYYKYSRDVRG